MVRWMIALGSMLAAFAARADTQPAAAIESPYSSRIMNFLKVWPSPYLREHDAGPIFLRAIKTPGRPKYVGMLKHYVVKQPLERLVAFTDRYEDYKKVWGDIVSITVVERGENHDVVEWVRPKPTFFMPEIRYRMLYTWDKSVPGRVVYRHQLVSGNALFFQDDLVVLERLDPENTRLTILNFFEPDMGPFGGLVTPVLWKSSMQGSFMDDVAFLSYWDHPDWDVRKLRAEAERMLELFPVTPIKFIDGFTLDAPVDGRQAEMPKGSAAAVSSR
jgi:hypothetical protein